MKELFLFVKQIIAIDSIIKLATKVIFKNAPVSGLVVASLS